MTDILDTAKGFLFVGDIHLSSRKPGTRKDVNFGATIFKKLEQVVEIANRDDLIIVIEGDIFDTPIESNETLKTRLTRVLKKSNHLCFTNTGNHDMMGDVLSDGDSLAVIAEYGNPLHVISSSGPVGVFLLNGVRVGLGMTPYGQTIPDNVSGCFHDVEGVIWVTHHDIAFDGAYPGSMEAHEIKGCSLVMNGHMHLDKPALQRGETTWVNNGSLVRTSKDAAYHKPIVTGVIPGVDELIRYPIEHDPHIFNMAGKMVAASPGEKVTQAHVESVFVSLLSSTQGDINPVVTDNGDVLLEDMKRVFQERCVRPEVQTYILESFRRMID